jgi:hypothetical protein
VVASVVVDGPSDPEASWFVDELSFAVAASLPLEPSWGLPLSPEIPPPSLSPLESESDEPLHAATSATTAQTAKLARTFLTAAPPEREISRYLLGTHAHSRAIGSKCTPKLHMTTAEIEPLALELFARVRRRAHDWRARLRIGLRGPCSFDSARLAGRAIDS